VITFGSPSILASGHSTSVYQALVENPVSALRVRPIPVKDPFSFYQVLRPHFDQSFMLESAPGSQRLAEFTFLGFGPRFHIVLARDALFIDGKPEGTSHDLLPQLRRLLEEHHIEGCSGLKYVGGLVGSIGYDYVRCLEPIPPHPKPHPFPEVELGLYLDGVVFDHRADQAFYFTQREDRAPFLMELFDQGAPPPGEPFACGQLRCDFDQAGFEEVVLKAKDAIRQGEAYQIVLSRQLEGLFSGDPLEGYQRLRAQHPSPYMYFLDHGQRAIAGASPEMLVSVQEGTVTTYPIAGTRPSGQTEEERRRLAQDLLADEKERAEHVMLVDLARNDVGRVAEPGSVHVAQYMAVERFGHVQHLVSCVQGRLRSGLDGFDALFSIFPAGTVSGAPKVRAMQLIAGWERRARGPYAGVVGYWSLNGNLDTAIAIRTAFFSGDRLFLQAGAGIVADSVPEREFQETEHKLASIKVAFVGRPAGAP